MGGSQSWGMTIVQPDRRGAEVAKANTSSFWLLVQYGKVHGLMRRLFGNDGKNE